MVRAGESSGDGSRKAKGFSVEGDGRRGALGFFGVSRERVTQWCVSAWGSRRVRMTQVFAGPRTFARTSLKVRPVQGMKSIWSSWCPTLMFSARCAGEFSSM